MALIITLCGPASNSYVTLDEAEARIAQAEYDSSHWSSLSQEAKEECLILAARVIDGLPLRGKKVNRRIPVGSWYSQTYGWLVFETERPEQAMAFPRTVQGDPTVIPQEVKDAQIDIAATVVARGYPPVGDAAANAQKQEIASVTLGSLSVRFKDKPTRQSFSFDPSDLALLSSAVIALKLQPYLSSVRGRRVDSEGDDVYARINDFVSVSSSSSSWSSSSSSRSSSSSSTSVMP